MMTCILIAIHRKVNNFVWHWTNGVMHSAAVNTTPCSLRCLRSAPPADVNMQFSISVPLCCIYLQAVPCDPAGADFNFAALSFNSEFLHQIHLIPLHPHSLSEENPDGPFFGFGWTKCCQRLDREKLRRGGNQSDPYHNFPSRPPADVLWFTTHTLPHPLSLSLIPRSLYPPPLQLFLSLSHTNSLQHQHWCVLVWRLKPHNVTLHSITTANKHVNL